MPELWWEYLGGHHPELKEGEAKEGHGSSWEKDRDDEVHRRETWHAGRG